MTTVIKKKKTPVIIKLAKPHGADHGMVYKYPKPKGMMKI
jgi:hypothetical protein